MNVKKTVLAILLLMSLVLMAACGSAKESTEPHEKGTGEVIPFSGYDLATDKLTDVTMLKGKKINLVTLWQVQCPPCETEGKALSILSKKHSDVGFIGLCIADTNDEVSKTVGKWGLNYTNYRLDKQFLEKMGDKVKKTPTLFFVDQEGRTLRPMQEGMPAQGMTAEELAKQLDETIRELKK